MDQPQENTNPEGQSATPPLDDSRDKPSQSNTKLLAGIVVVLGVLVAVGAGVYLLSNSKEGYYTYGQNCASDSECICVGSKDISDQCGKVGQYPACIDNVCSWRWEGDLSDTTEGVMDIPDPATSDVEGWQTYRDEEYGVEFRYPNDWFSTSQRVAMVNPNLVFSAEDSDITAIKRFGVWAGYNVPQFALLIYPSTAYKRDEVIDVQKLKDVKTENSVITVSGLTANEFIYRIDMGREETVIQMVEFTKDDMTYVLIFTYDYIDCFYLTNPSKTECAEEIEFFLNKQNFVFTQILSTFKFIE